MYPLFLVQAENDLNELRALMHSPNAIVVSARFAQTLNWAEWQSVSTQAVLEVPELYQ